MVRVLSDTTLGCYPNQARKNVTYFRDFTDYTFLTRTDGLVPELGALVGDAKNVAWLSPDEPVSYGDAPPELYEALCLLATMRTRWTRGVHLCELCPRADDIDVCYKRQIVTCASSTYNVGSAELQVPNREQEWFVAPDLILHYVACHGFLPPQEFVVAAISYATHHVGLCEEVAGILCVRSEVIRDNVRRPLGPVRGGTTRWAMHSDYARLLKVANSVTLFSPYEGLVLWGSEEFSDAEGDDAEAPGRAAVLGLQPIAGEWPVCAALSLDDGSVVFGDLVNDSRCKLASSLGEYVECLADRWSVAGELLGAAGKGHL